MFEPNAVDDYIRVNPATGFIEPNWKERDILTYALGPDPAQVSGAIALGTPPVLVPYKLPHTSLSMDDMVGNPLMIDQITFLETLLGSTLADYTIQVSDFGDQRQYMNFPIHIRTFAGSGQLSARLSEPLFLPTRHQLMLRFHKLSAASAQSTRLFLIGKLFDTWSSNLQKYRNDHADMVKDINYWLERRKYVFPYWMTTENGVVNVPANQTVFVDSLIGDEGHFEATAIMRAFGTAQTSNPFEVELLNPQTRQSYMNGSIHSYMIGDALNPQPLPAPALIPSGSILRFKIKDLSGSANAVHLTLRGRKIRAPIKDIAQVKREFGIDQEPKKALTGYEEMVGME